MKCYVATRDSICTKSYEGVISDNLIAVIGWEYCHCKFYWFIFSNKNKKSTNFTFSCSCSQYFNKESFQVDLFKVDTVYLSIEDYFPIMKVFIPHCEAGGSLWQQHSPHLLIIIFTNQKSGKVKPNEWQIQISSAPVCCYLVLPLL